MIHLARGTGVDLVEISPPLPHELRDLIQSPGSRVSKADTPRQARYRRLFAVLNISRSGTLRFCAFGGVLVSVRVARSGAWHHRLFLLTQSKKAYFVEAKR